MPDIRPGVWQTITWLPAGNQAISPRTLGACKMTHPTVQKYTRPETKFRHWIE